MPAVLRLTSLVALATVALLLVQACDRGDRPAAAAPAAAPGGHGLRCPFDGGLAGWTSAGDVAIDAAQGCAAAGSLRLSRTLQRIDDATWAASPAVAVTPGMWSISGALSGDLHAPDSSYKAQLHIDWAGADGAAIEGSEIANLSGRTAWRPFRKQVEAPAGAATARVRIVLDKTHGTCRLDDLVLAFAGSAPPAPLVDRFTWSSPSFCNLIEPGTRPVITTTVEAFRPLAEDQRRLTWQVCDYWGAEVGAPGSLVLAEAGTSKRGRAAYRAEVDLGVVGLETGRYYELHVRLDLPGIGVAQDRTTLAILPEPASKRFRPEQIPFTSRNWDHRMDMHPRLSDRIGLRVCGIWGGFPAEQPERTDMPQFDHAERLGMQMITGMPSHAIENHHGDYKTWTVEKMRVGTRAMLAGYAKRGLRKVVLGNEPPGLEERACEALPYYAAIYEEVKRFDPTIEVIGTSVGPVEAFFKAGFQDHLDAFDFHVYEDVNGIRNCFAEYERLFTKYNCRKPIVSTELGLNSQGMPRIAIANDLVRKLSVFFALGGAHCSWFDLFYPDPDGKITGSNGDSFNAFNCLYECYSPRLDAIAYYNMINGILDKRCLGERIYPDGIVATMFRDAAGACFLSIYADKGRHDVFVPLPGTGAVRVIRIDGSTVDLDAAGTGLTLGIGQDALLLSWSGGAAALPAELGAPRARLVAAPAGVVKGGSVAVTASLDGIAAGKLSLTAPAGWQVAGPVAGTADGRPTATWTLAVPTVTAAREGRIAIGLGGPGELAFGIPVTGVVSTSILPVVQTAEGTAGVRLLVRNNGQDSQRVSTALSLVGEYVMARNNYDTAKPVATSAFFAELPEAEFVLAPGAERTVQVALNGLDPQAIYRVRAVATDQGGIVLARERMLAGFAGAPRAQAPLRLDGVLDEADWARAPLLRMHEERQFWGYDGRTWRGASDLSGDLRVLWDDTHLYVGVRMVDDVQRNVKQDAEIWAGDGLQFLFDPCRESPEKIGKYDYSLGLGRKGAQTWCTYSADPRAPSGESPDIRISAKPFPEGGGMVYEVAFPWTRLAPFAPAAGRNLGMAMILNDDDGTGRDCYMGWFSGVSTKEVDVVGDIMLLAD